MAKYWKCGICRETVKRASIACVVCRPWVHWKCTEDIHNCQEAQASYKTYTCINCKTGT